jgi:MYXO-CTERM domain-containing protein
MKRLLGSNWKRIGLQVGLLAGIGLAFAVGTHEQPAEAGGLNCPLEDDCSFKKPNIMIIMDYSTSMNAVWDNNLTRWQVTVAAVQQVAAPGSFLSQNTHLALTRFGHDPNANSSGTLIPNDTSGLVDGQKLDVAWDDANNNYYPCNGQGITDSLNATPAPMNGNMFGIGTWTKGALDFVAAEIAQTKADHPDDQEDTPRAYVNVLLTDGAWTGVDGTTPLAPANQNPAITAANLYNNQNIPTYVVAVAGDAPALAAAEELAQAGGTGSAIDGDTPQALEAALQAVVVDIINSVVAPECIGGLPRVMILLDASSSMLNVGNSAGAMGATGWDQAREALAGDDSLFDVDAGVGTVEDVSHLGLAVFGHNAPAPGEQKILVNYGPCMKDNFGWALDPNTSCELPGCTNPWSGPPITWTFKDGTGGPPGFDQQTNSHMPKCDLSPGDQRCLGSGTYTHLGLQLIKNNQVTYHQAGQQQGVLYPTTPGTIYFNILITDGQYSGFSTDAQVQTELTQMYNAGIKTYVIGFGDGVNTPAAIQQLSSMANWGSGNTENYFDADNQTDLEAALATIFGGLVFDPCCALNDCSQNPEPTTNEPDPIPNPTTSTTGDGDGDGDGDGNDDPTTGDGDGDGNDDPTTGDGDGDGNDDPTTGDGDGDTNDGSSADDEIGDDDETGGTGSTGGVDADDGCNCSTVDTDEEKTRGLLGAFLALGLAGLVRRRRRD